MNAYYGNIMPMSTPEMYYNGDINVKNEGSYLTGNSGSPPMPHHPSQHLSAQSLYEHSEQAYGGYGRYPHFDRLDLLPLTATTASSAAKQTTCGGTGLPNVPNTVHCTSYPTHSGSPTISTCAGFTNLNAHCNGANTGNVNPSCIPYDDIPGGGGNPSCAGLTPRDGSGGRDLSSHHAAHQGILQHSSQMNNSLGYPNSGMGGMPPSGAHVNMYHWMSLPRTINGGKKCKTLTCQKKIRQLFDLIFPTLT